MKIAKYLLPILIALSCLHAQAEPPAVRIMPVGDSITEGGSFYRPILLEKLKSAGYRVEYVGSKKTYGGLPHEGYSGKNAQFLAKTVPAHFAQYPADIVLLHAGHNNFAEKKPVPDILAATETMITEFRKTNPKVIVLLAQVIPSGRLPKYAYIPELNAELAKLAARFNTPEQPVIIVDQFTGFDPMQDTVDDHVHPNASGAEKMATRWFEALKPILDSKQRER